MDDNSWNDFWKRRERGWGQRIIQYARRRLLTAPFVKFLQQNLPSGDILEAGCGTALISLHIANIREGEVVLLDNSEEALKLTRELAGKSRSDVRVICGDLRKLDCILDRPVSCVYNIGVVEHFFDWSPVLQQMAKMSENYALAIVPLQSVFWLTYYHTLRILRLCPPLESFYVRFYSRKDAVACVRKAGVELLETKVIRICGVIPYLSIKFRSWK